MAKKHKFSVLMFDAAYPPPVVGGKEKQAHLLSRELLKSGIDVKILSFQHNGNKSGKHEGVPIIRLRRSTCGMLHLLLSIIRLRFSYTILHIHTPSRIGKILAFFGWVIRYKIVFKFPGQNLINTNSKFRAIFWIAFPKILSAIVVLEDNTRQLLLKSGTQPEKIFPLFNGVIANRKRKPRSDGQINLIFVGRLVPIKMVNDILVACSCLNLPTKGWELTILGDGPLSSDLKASAHSLGIGDKTNFLGYQPDSLSSMMASDVLILSSEKEGMSNVILEAMSIGLPVVATDVGAANSMLGTFGKQFICQVNSPADISEKISVLAQDDTLREEYGDYLYHRCIELFSINSVAKNYISLYGSL